MVTLADTLARFVDRSVVDMTNLQGRYDAMPPQALRLVDTTSPAAVPDALKALGLALEPRRAALDVVVIDSMERSPTES